ncbi:SLF1 protein, partial [Rynchops niger]|nr:SLF1 protein [Rynchops niger]
QVASGGQRRIVQITGFKKEEKEALLEWLFRLDCVFLNDKKYRNCTHLIAKKLSKSEKFLAACAAGKWILTKEYIINSAESGRWLDETTYEWGYEIEKDTHYSPQRQSAPKRWREELARSGAPGAFHKWKVVLPVKEGDKQMASIRRVLQAGKATICSSQNAECTVTHIFINNEIFPMQNKKISEAPYYTVQYIGDYLFENEIQNTEDTQMNHFLTAQETNQIMSNMQLSTMKNAVIKHMYFAVVTHQVGILTSFETVMMPFNLFNNHIFPTSTKSHPVQPPAMSMDIFKENRLLQALSSRALNPSRDGAATASLGNLGQGLTPLTAKNFFPISHLNLPSFSLKQLCPCPIASGPTKKFSAVFLVGPLQVKNTNLSRGTWYMLEGLLEEYLFPDVITELAAGQGYSTPPMQLLHSLLEHVLLGNSDAIFYAKLHHTLYLVLQRDPPWKSSSMLKYYLDLLQCPICKKGTWSLIEMLVRSCLYCKTICHAVPVSGRGDEQRIVHKTLLKFFFDLIKAEVEFLTERLVEGTNSQHQQVMPQTVLLKTFWLGSQTSVLFTKHINILTDWVILSYRELNRKNDAFRCEIAGLLNAILGTVVEYWIVSSLHMDRNVFHQIADDLAQYIAISCDDFSISELKTFICSIPSLWLQMFVAEAFFKKMCLQRNITISKEPLSLQKIVCSYSPALREVGMHETRNIQNTKKKKRKMGQWPCPESQRALQMLNGDKQNQVKVLPDLPDLIFNKCPPMTKRLRAKAEVESSYTKENYYVLAEKVHFCRRNIKGETALHRACIRNKVDRLIQLLSSPGADINAKDYAGWTPLHEACNHGSTVCVREILQRCPEVDLLSQVDGVTPLHDALSNGHVEIGKLLLQHGGPALLQQRDSNGKLPLDYVESIPVKQELLNVVHPEKNIDSFYECTEQDFRSQQRELWLILFNKMVLNFCSVYNLSSPFTLTLRDVACSNVLPLMAHGNCKMKNVFSADWLVDTYFRELESFQKLPQFLQEISANLLFFPGEQMKALLATLETMVEAYQLL